MANCAAVLGANWMAWVDATEPPSSSVAPASMASVPVPVTLLVTLRRCRPSVRSATASIVPLLTIEPPPRALRVPPPLSVPPFNPPLPASTWTIGAPSVPVKRAVPPASTSKVPPTVRLAVL